MLICGFSPIELGAAKKPRDKPPSIGAGNEEAFELALKLNF
jgi:hypothetical protein